MNKPPDNPLTAMERGREQAMAHPAATERHRIRTNRVIERRPHRRFHWRMLVNRGRHFNTWDVWFTHSRERWYRDLRRAPKMKYRAILGLMSRKWKRLKAADKTLWEDERWRLDMRRRAFEEMNSDLGELPDPPAWWFQHPPPNPGREWLHWRVLYKAGFGSNILCLSIDDDEQIDDRAVLKFADRLSGSMDHPMNEIFYHRHAASICPRNVVGFRSSRHFPVADTLRYAIFMDYCPYGGMLPGIDDVNLPLTLVDLSSLVRIYKHKSITKGPRPPEPWVPEPFLWKLFEDLATVGVALRVMPRRRMRGLPPGSVLHNDIKLGNIFLGDSIPGILPNNFPAYPSAFLGDFGHAKGQSAAVPTQVQDGTFGWRAPERFPNLNYPKAPGQRSDVWSVGMVMYCLMERKANPLGLKWERPYVGSHNIAKGGTAHRWHRKSNMYSYALKHLVKTSHMPTANLLQRQWPHTARPARDDDMIGAGGAFEYQLRFIPDRYPVNGEAPTNERDWDTDSDEFE
ncbi:hypothetical protein NA57DRAFT_54389 [Rhizodiscina lignyota]|uniref:Protein kinase domain-containing protein n=1 Tax=Rhizodiscina lignyota TaxID=1504668 RepID=A0A9P4IIL0_9PEZI|nr:hypothetical protein NA57DRAFT_54389 [Rhizodiscina lignyota]